MSKHVNERFTEFQLGIEPDNTISTLCNFKKSANNKTINGITFLYRIFVKQEVSLGTIFT